MIKHANDVGNLFLKLIRLIVTVVSGGGGSRGGGGTHKREGQSIISPIFPQKLHENEILVWEERALRPTQIRQCV